MVQVSIQVFSSLAFIFTEKTLTKRISLLTLIKKNMQKFCWYLQMGPCWDYLCKWQRDTEILNERTKTRTHFCPRSQLLLTNRLP